MYFVYICFLFFVIFKKFFKKFAVKQKSDEASLTDVYSDYTNIM